MEFYWPEMEWYAIHELYQSIITYVYFFYEIRSEC